MSNKSNVNIQAFREPVTREDVEIVVKRALGTKTKLINYHARTYSEEKVGLMGLHRHLIVTIQRDGSDEKETEIFFVKTVPYNIEAQVAVIENSQMFYKEISFYKHIMPELMSSVKDKSWCAQCYLMKDDALMFEDLKSRDFGVKDKLLDLIHIKSALSALAKLHGSSMLAEKRMGKSFGDLYADVFKESLFSRERGFSEWVRTGVDVAIGIAKELGLEHANIPEVCDRIIAILANPTGRKVVSHGDAWSFNLMFDKAEPIPNCILVDFQLVRYVPASVDILQLFYLTMRREFREKNERSLLKHYHEVLSATLRDNDDEIYVPTLQEVLEEYESLRVVGVVTATLYYPVLLVDAMECSDMTKDSDGYSKLLFQDRVDLVLEIMKKDPNYKAGTTEIVRELVQRSRQLLQ